VTMKHKLTSEPSQALDEKECRKSFLASTNTVLSHPECSVLGCR
jgi:hypothetical protein